MTPSSRKLLRPAICLTLLIAAGSPALRAQALDAPPPTVPNDSPSPHRFWDRENTFLFSGVGAARAFDYSSTLNMRRRGRQEILLTDWVVDHHPLFAGIEIGATVLSIGASYAFHRTGHHQLERWVSIVHIGLAATGDVRNYSLQTAHTIPSNVATSP